MKRTRLAAVIGTVAFTATGLGAGAVLAACGSTAQAPAALFADAPGPRVSPAEATRLGSQVPAGATAGPTQNKITFSGASVRFTVLASPPGGQDETFRIAGMTNPTIVVKAGARVSIEVINADPDTAHGLVVTASGATSSWMPMLAARPAFTGSPLWFLGNPHQRTCTPGRSALPPPRRAPTGTCAPSPGTPRKA
jgi:hypothetical protein